MVCAPWLVLLVVSFTLLEHTSSPFLDRVSRSCSDSFVDDGFCLGSPLVPFFFPKRRSFRSARLVSPSVSFRFSPILRRLVPFFRPSHGNSICPSSCCFDDVSCSYRFHHAPVGSYVAPCRPSFHPAPRLRTSWLDWTTSSLHLPRTHRFRWPVREATSSSHVHVHVQSTFQSNVSRRAEGTASQNPNRKRIAREKTLHG